MGHDAGLLEYLTSKGYRRYDRLPISYAWSLPDRIQGLTRRELIGICLLTVCVRIRYMRGAFIPQACTEKDGGREIVLDGLRHNHQ